MRLAIDPTMGDTGRMHLVWLEVAEDAPLGGLPPPPNPIMAAYSDDGGTTFSDPVEVSDPARPLPVAPPSRWARITPYMSSTTTWATT